MKALGKLKPERGIWMYDAPKPTPGPNDLLIKITKTAICGTDLHIFNWDDWAQKNVPVPITTGHEFAGIVEAVGSEVAGYQPRDRVSGEGHLTCGHCRNCRAGTRHLCRNTVGIGYHKTGVFSEYFTIPAVNAFLLPDEIPDEIAAFMDPLGNATHTALSFDLVGEDVLITGAGPVGLLAIPICKHAGARHIVITDVNEYRLNLAREMGATAAINANQDKFEDVMDKLGIVEGFDVGLEMSGSPSAMNQLLEFMNHGGKVALLGLLPKHTTIDWDKVIFKGLILKGIYGREMFETWYKMASMLKSGLDVNKVLTHTFPVDDYEKAFEVMLSGQSGKVILDWT